MQKRPLRPFEHGAHLHVLDWAHSTARYRFQAAGAAQVKAAAKALVGASVDTSMDASGPPQLPSLEAALTAELAKLYALGHATVRSELDHQLHGSLLPVGLSAAPVPPAGDRAKAKQLAGAEPARDPGRLRARARLSASDVAHAIWQAIHRARLLGISDKRKLRQIGRDAGNAALGQSASQHAGGAIAAGREAAALSAIAGGGEAGAPAAQIIGARYTSVLDKSTCGPCAEADTGELIPIGDPAWIPTPNPACLGGGRCRCIHVYQLSTEVRDPPQQVAAGA